MVMGFEVVVIEFCSNTVSYTISVNIFMTLLMEFFSQ